MNFGRCEEDQTWRPLVGKMAARLLIRTISVGCHHYIVMSDNTCYLIHNIDVDREVGTLPGDTERGCMQGDRLKTW